MTRANKSASSAIPALISRLSLNLKSASIDSAEAEMELILCHVLEVDRLNLYLHGESLLDSSVLTKIEEIVDKRTMRYPLQYILQESWFYGRSFYVDESVMVPAPETELLCKAAMGFCETSGLTEPPIIDIGTGSGVIPITLACEMKNAKITAVDISEAALAVARKNAEAHDVDEQITFLQSDLFDDVNKSQKFDLILSNPPYITDEESSGADGLDVIRVILKKAPDYLAENGRIMFEIGHKQSETISKLVESDDHYSSISILKDLNEIDRIVILSCGN
jgi:release factor glutamine methyltransferase